MTNELSSPPDRWSLHGKRMRVVAAAEASALGRDTRFQFSESDQLFSACYEGGGIRLGYLVGSRRENRAEFRYAQMTTTGVLDGGVSHCELVAAPEGRLRLVEHFQWESRDGSGTNIFEELFEGEA